VISAARNVLNDYLPDVWVYSDLAKGTKTTTDSGYSICLIAETNE